MPTLRQDRSQRPALDWCNKTWARRMCAAETRSVPRTRRLLEEDVEAARFPPSPSSGGFAGLFSLFAADLNSGWWGLARSWRPSSSRCGLVQEIYVSGVEVPRKGCILLRDGSRRASLIPFFLCTRLKEAEWHGGDRGAQGEGHRFHEPQRKF